MRKLTFLILVVFITFSVACVQGNEGNKDITTQEDRGITLPDYSEWEKFSDHSKPYLYKGEPVNLFIKYYSSEKGQMITAVFYHPETEKEWIAFHLVFSEDGVRDYLFEKNGKKWDFFKEVSGINVLNIFKERYDIVSNEPF